jgi:UDP-galactopyranose mutase
MTYDYLIVGSGLFGSVCARELTDKGYSCCVIDKRNHIGGNCYTENKEGINIHKYGSHIFHTSDKKIWEYINKFGTFNNYKHHVVANFKGKIYSLPFSMWTFNQMWGVTTPSEAQSKIESQKFKGVPSNLEEQALSLVGSDVYSILIKGYTKKQWRKPLTDLPSSIIKRLPVRFTYDNNYFNDTYQGIPIGGYTKIFENLLKNITVKLNTDFFEDSLPKYKKLIYTGPIDRFFNYEFGKLEYRGLKFQHEKLPISNFQGHSVVNYTDEETPYTRIHEHKHYEFGTQPYTYITYEYPLKTNNPKEPIYPINNDLNQKIYKKYREKADNLENIHFGGRLAEYRYYDMHQIIGSALSKIDKWTV